MELRAGDNVVWNAVPGELVLLNADTGGYYALDDVGADVWRLLMDLGAVGAVKERMAAMYDADAATIAADVDRLVAELRESRLLVEATGGG